MTQARSTTIERNPVDLKFLMAQWGIETHTFEVSWGDFSPLLEDVAMLTSLLLFGKAYTTRLLWVERIIKGRVLEKVPLELQVFDQQCYLSIMGQVLRLR